MVKTLQRSRSDLKCSFGSSECDLNPRGHPSNLASFVPVEVLSGPKPIERSEEVSGPKQKRVHDARSASQSPTSFGRPGWCSLPSTR